MHKQSGSPTWPANESRFTELVRNDEENLQIYHITIHHALTIKETCSNNVIIMEQDNSQQMNHKRQYTCALASKDGEYSHEILLLVYMKEKSLKMKRDVGMACQKVHKQGTIKVMVSIQSLIHPNIFSQE